MRHCQLVLSLWAGLCSTAAHAEPARLASAALAPAHLAIVIDDIGYNLAQSERAARLSGQFTLAILPFTPHGQQVAALAQRQGKELMLHLPMSNLKNMPLGKGGLTTGMAREAVVATLRADLASLPPVRGVNNHMGSKLTQDADIMGWVMAELAARDLYFIDSRTSPLTQAQKAAEQQGLRAYKRDVFLDDVIEPSEIRRQFDRALQLARQQGSALAIGHPYPATLQLLENIQPLLERTNIRLVFASQLTHRTRSSPKAIAANETACPAPPRFSWFIAKTADYHSDMSPYDVDLYDVTDMMTLQLFGY